VTYTPEFFDQITAGSVRSAEIVLPDVVEGLSVTSVVDVGCGVASWASVAKALGCRVRGVDGHVPDGKLLIHPSEFLRTDLASAVDFGCRRGDLAICLEVAEHLPESSARTLVAGLCEARWVLFSAAIPGQGGVGHLNEQWGTWWAALFAEHGLVGSCDLRWKHWDDRLVENWYRQNLILFGSPGALEARGYRAGVVDVVHPERLGIWPA
jgi:hypothetical protein